MLIFGHAGITLATAALIDSCLFKRYSLPNRKGELDENLEFLSEKSFRQDRTNIISSLFISLGNHIDIRVLLIGSLLPDIVDKPLGLLLLQDIIGNGRIFCHTLLFLIFITTIGLFLYISRRKTSVLVLSFGIFTHLVLDMIWRIPKTLFWPLLGLSFETYEPVAFSDWLQSLYQGLLAFPVIGIPELIGATIIIWFVYMLIRRKKLNAFLKKGWI